MQLRRHEMVHYTGQQLVLLPEFRLTYQRIICHIDRKFKTLLTHCNQALCAALIDQTALQRLTQTALNVYMQQPDTVFSCVAVQHRKFNGT